MPVILDRITLTKLGDHYSHHGLMVEADFQDDLDMIVEFVRQEVPTCVHKQTGATVFFQKLKDRDYRLYEFLRDAFVTLGWEVEKERDFSAQMRSFECVLTRSRLARLEKTSYARA